MKRMRLLIFMVLLILGTVTNLGYTGVIDFEGVPQTYWANGGNQNIWNYYDGIIFFPQAVIYETQVYGYNSASYPPHSGYAVLASPYANNSIDAVFASPTNEVSLWYTSNSNLYLDAYDSSNTLIGSTSGAANLGTTSFLQFISATSNIALVIIHDSGNFFSIDDFESPSITGQPSAVPLPPTLLLLASGLIGLIGIRRKFKN